MTEARTLQIRRPISPLSDHVECCWAGGHDGRRGAAELVLPTGAPSLVFSVDDIGTCAALIAGPHSRPITLDTSRGFVAVGVRFRTGGAFPIVQTPSDELHNQIVRLEDIWGGEGRCLEEALWEARTADEQFAVIERALWRRLSRAPARHPGVAYALRAIDRSRGNCKVGELADDVGMSSRRLAQLFEREVGLSPKLCCRMRRFVEALRLIESSAQLDWAEIALACGYYDQAHFNHDFRAFCGMEPSSYVRRRLSPTHVALDG